MKRLLIFSFLFLSLLAPAQQVSDTAYTFAIQQPRYAKEKGSAVWIDEAHYNFHRLKGRYRAFAKILDADGYLVRANTQPFTKKNLRQCKILVIANALNEANRENWTGPNPSAFTPQEITCIKQWVEKGGRLFMIADHMPFGGAIQDLASAFGLEWMNGFAISKDTAGTDQFTRGQGGLDNNEITNGYETNEKIDTVITFTGSAFKIPATARPILRVDSMTILLPEEAWVFKPTTPQISGVGLCQGAYLSYGQGKIVAFGEAAMFTAQITNGIKSGLNVPKARQNNQLLLNIVHWLDQP